MDITASPILRVTIRLSRIVSSMVSLQYGSLHEHGSVGGFLPHDFLFHIWNISTQQIHPTSTLPLFMGIHYSCDGESSHPCHFIVRLTSLAPFSIIETHGLAHRTGNNPTRSVSIESQPLIVWLNSRVNIALPMASIFVTMDG